MITREAWNVELLEKSALEQDLERSKSRLLQDPQDTHALTQQAIQSWRAGRPSALEELTVSQPSPQLTKALLEAAESASYVPYSYDPSLFLSSRGVYGGPHREQILNYVIRQAEKRHPDAVSMVSYLVAQGMDLDEDNDTVMRLAVAIASETPELLISIIQGGDEYDTVLQAASEAAMEGFYSAAVDVGIRTRNSDVLEWVWEPEVFQYHNENGRPPDMPWEVVFSMPKDKQPTIDYTITYHDLIAGVWHSDEPEGEKVDVPLEDFASIFSDWSSFDFTDSSMYYSGDGRIETDLEPVEGDEDTDIRYPELSQTAIYLEPYYMRDWVGRHWPPPNTSQQEGQ